MTRNRPRVLLADDHLGTIAQLQQVLETEFDVIATAEDGRALVYAVERLSPDVIVTDMSMPVLDGMSAAAAILRRNPLARVVVVTADWDDAVTRHGLSLGILGYVRKPSAGDELVPAVKAALRGERWCVCS